MRLRTSLCRSGLFTAAIFFSFPVSQVQAGEPSLHLDHTGLHVGHHDHNSVIQAPIGVMGDHMHGEGDFMFSYRFMHMDMDGSRNGTDRIDPVTIATTQANKFAGMAGQPPTLRVVPTEMSMDMHMLGAMYAPRDWLTLMAMVNYVEKSMSHITFAGGAGTTVLGEFSTESEGWDDVKVGGLFRLFEDDIHHVHLNVGFSLPTGSIDEEGTVLAPTGATPKLRLPYAMQLGSGTYDFLPGITYTGQRGLWGWGAQYMAELGLEDDNREGYALGDKHRVTAWGIYQWAPWVSSSARINAYTQDAIDGIDAQIVAPVQTADPDNYGGDVLELSLGVNFIATKGVVKGHRFAVEGTAPLYRNLNGPQLETDWSVTLGLQYAF